MAEINHRREGQNATELTQTLSGGFVFAPDQVGIPRAGGTEVLREDGGATSGYTGDRLLLRSGGDSAGGIVAQPFLQLQHKIPQRIRAERM